MPQDPVQIALEHHRAGRFRLAEAGYRAVLADRPDDADALHWLGVLLCQAGQAAAAVLLLGRAAGRRPDDPAFQYNLGQACLAAGRLDDAVDAFDRVASLDPARVEALVGAAQARLARRQPGDAEAAVNALQQARDAGLDTAALHHDLGVALLSAKLVDPAIASLRTALERDRDHASAHYHLALAYRSAGEAKDVRRHLNKALEVEPTMAKAWYALAGLDAEAGNLEQAASLFRRAVRARADYAAAYEGLARVLDRLGRRDEAEIAKEQAERAARGEIPRQAAGSGTAPRVTSIEEMERRLTPGSDAARFHQALAALANVFPPAQVPQNEVSELFDRYAGRFDEHLTGALGYRGPELITGAVADELGPRAAERSLDVLDVGCGTGLCGPLLRPMARTLAGVDLSAAMIDRARERGVYDRLAVGDLVDAMRTAPRSADVIAAADVLIYVGDLAPTFEAAAACLRPGGVFAFTVESGPGDRYLLNQQTRRFTHAASYLHHLASIYGFEEVRFEASPVRAQSGQPVPGYLVVLRLAG